MGASRGRAFCQQGATTEKALSLVATSLTSEGGDIENRPCVADINGQAGQ